MEKSLETIYGKRQVRTARKPGGSSRGWMSTNHVLYTNYISQVWSQETCATAWIIRTVKYQKAARRTGSAKLRTIRTGKSCFHLADEFIGAAILYTPVQKKCHKSSLRHTYGQDSSNRYSDQKSRKTLWPRLVRPQKSLAVDYLTCPSSSDGSHPYKWVPISINRKSDNNILWATRNLSWPRTTLLFKIFNCDPDLWIKKKNYLATMHGLAQWPWYLPCREVIVQRTRRTTHFLGSRPTEWTNCSWV